jgi:hypothetical protein
MAIADPATYLKENVSEMISGSEAARFERDVLALTPSIITIDYSVNDRGCGIQKAEAAWRQMIEQSLERQIKLLLTPTFDVLAAKNKC